MKSSFRQHLLKWRACLGAITLLCLLWHIFLPTMVQTGVVPALYAMPSHCQVTEIQNASVMIHTHSAHQHSMHEIHHSPQLQHSKHPELSSYAQEVFALASQIMKHCPLCSHGLDAAILMPLIALIFTLLLAWFSRVRCLCYTWTEDLHIPRISYIFPIKQAPPFAV